ncbi:hypothetical protein MtrunA17_Chr5g0438341 [Medicago truncatula]|uniref:Uncharacterized protein n=1 Tax=Medicago truncatula TaxID=3880 RepID=A0A396HXL1_MEDTR|nr:hypothetical protein MtrunA17_Chr5g0438341 [Medicago truncatula]
MGILYPPPPPFPPFPLPPPFRPVVCHPVPLVILISLSHIVPSTYPFLQ